MKRRFENRPIGRFPGEFFALGLLLCLGIQILWGPVPAIMTAAIIGLFQVFALRKQRLAGRSTADRLAEAEAEAKRWQERATAFQAELACFRDQVDYQDPETGVGSTRQFEVEFIKQVARQRRRGEGFAVALLQVRDPEHPDDMLDTPMIVAAAHRLAETARVEDSLCRVARRGFAVLLTGADRPGAEVFIHRAQQRFEDTPVIVAGKRLSLAVTGGVAVYDSTMTEVQEILTAAARDLHARLFPGSAEPTPIRRPSDREPIPLRRAS